MKNIIKVSLALVAFGLFAITFSAFSVRHAVAGGSPPAANGLLPLLVKVTNTPLPVQGSVAVNNTPSVTVANTPSVNVANTPTVSLANPSVGVSNALDNASNPIPLLVSPRVTPYESTCSIGNPAALIDSCQFSAIPAGQELIVQQFNAAAFPFLGTSLLDVNLEVGWNGQGINHSFPIATNGSDGAQLHEAVHEQTTIYADTSFVSTPICQAVATSQKWTITCAISGYLVPAQ